MTKLLSCSFWFMLIGALGTVLFFLNQNRVDEWVTHPLLSGAIKYGPLIIFGSGAILSRLGIRHSKNQENENVELKKKVVLLEKQGKEKVVEFEKRIKELEQRG